MTHRRIAVFDILRVVGMIFVMFIHSPVEGDATSSPSIFLLKGFFASGAVPVFFLLSGYFGAKSLQNPDLRFSAFAQNKLHTLIVPYLFWNLLVLILVLSVKASGLASNIPGGGAYFGVDFTAWSILSAVCGIDRYPIVYQFWFLRDLIVISFLAFFICRSLPKIPLLPWFFFFIPLPMASSLGYYLLGQQLHGILSPNNLPTVRSSILFCLCWVAMGMGDFAGLINIPYPIQQIGSAGLLLMVAILLSATRWSHKLAVLGSATFFVYATHEPLQTIIGKLWQALNLPFYGSLFCFLLIPASVFCLCVYAFFLLSKFAPQIMSLATGHRDWSSIASTDATPTGELKARHREP